MRLFKGFAPERAHDPAEDHEADYPPRRHEEGARAWVYDFDSPEKPSDEKGNYSHPSPAKPMIIHGEVNRSFRGHT